MRRSQQIAAMCFLVFSAYLMWESWNNLEYYTPLGPRCLLRSIQTG